MKINETSCNGSSNSNTNSTKNCIINKISSVNCLDGFFFCALFNVQTTTIIIFDSNTSTKKIKKGHSLRNTQIIIQHTHNPCHVTITVLD